MDITSIFKDSLTYPTKDWGKVLTLGLLLLGCFILFALTFVAAILSQTQYLTTIILGIITLVFGIIVGLIYNGYGLSITRETIIDRGANVENLPYFKWLKNIVDGLKVFVLHVVYMIIPIAIGIILAYALGLFSDMVTFNQIVNSSNYTSMTGGDLVGLQTNYVLVQLVYGILSVIFTLFAIIARARLAETGKLASIIQFSEILDTIGKIKWGNYIVWYILLMIITVVISFIAGLLLIIPILGFVIYSLIVIPFLLLFTSRAVGLIYNESKNFE
ncbi:hypothetical protein MBCUT_02870 [Methanobrevibacter cuticularis]|uniref:DUF4013 domain-containing protein n=1 Tax=Methanobrevibacter cuticularis TaxID=47311 RepID=A0A166F215_9EURY|nr:DUF4013 domain-containing protein [Methanobrevibacter cuticularis]KZX17240.1 hypothetical protein MBCUT_02870 [Methanobrevibacter cuticularis]